MQRRLCEMSEAKWSITEAKCLQISQNKHASQRDAISPPKGNLMLSHSAGMHNIGISITGISKRFHFASLHYIFSAYLPTPIKFLTEFLILRYAMGQKKSPAWWVPHRRRYLMRWLGGFITAPNFYILFLVTCQDNVNQSGNVGHVHYAVGVDVASSVCVSCSAENLVDKSSNVRYVNHAVGVDIALSAWLL